MKIIYYLAVVMTLFSICCFASSSEPQKDLAGTFKLTGTIRDASTNEPLSFASISVEGTSLGEITDERGRFLIDIQPGDYNLKCSYVGYKTKTIPVSIQGDVNISITLNSLDVLLQNVTIYAHKQNEASDQKEVSALSVQSEKIKKVTSIMPDVLRTVQLLPGVTSDNEFSAKFNVRGGNVDENLVLINGTQVYEPYHVKEASNASIGIFNTDLIKKMDLIAGGFSARYGDRMSSVVNIDYREGNRENYSGRASLSMTDIDALAEGPLGNDGSFILGARHSYLQYVLKLLDETSVNPSFYDLQGVFSYSLAPQHKLSFKFIHAGDNFTEDPNINYYGPYNYPASTTSGLQGMLNESWNDSSESYAQYYSSMLALQSTNILSSRALLKTELSYYNQQESTRYWELSQYRNVFAAKNVNAFYNNSSIYLNDNNLTIKTLELNTSFDYQFGSLYGIKTGASYLNIFYNRKLTNLRTIDEISNQYHYPDTTRNFRNENQFDSNLDSINTKSYKLAGYLENIFQFGDNLIFNAGGRFDYFQINKDLTWSPRINLAYKLTPALTLRGAWGFYYQSPIYQQLAYSVASDTNTQSQKSTHYIVSAEYDLISDALNQNFLKIKVEGYYKKYDDLISSTISSDGIISYSKKNDAEGRTTGMDFYFMYSNSWFSGWISYSLLKAEQKMYNDSNGYFPRNTDQRHTISAVADLDLGKNWNVSTRFVYGSGYSYTPSTSVYNSTKKVWEWQPGNPNSEHLPAYRRIDLRISKDFPLFGFSSSVFLDVNNVFNFKNVMSYRYGFYNQGQPKITEIDLWPIIPSIGMTVKF